MAIMIFLMVGKNLIVPAMFHVEFSEDPAQKTTTYPIYLQSSTDGGLLWDTIERFPFLSAMSGMVFFKNNHSLWFLNK